jgi:hypothetical protein
MDVGRFGDLARQPASSGLVIVFMHPRACHVLAIAQKGTRMGPEDPGTTQGEEMLTRFREQALMIQVHSFQKI